MFRLSRAVKLIGIVLSLLVLSGTVFVAAQQLFASQQAQLSLPQLPTVLRSPSATRPSHCVPFPSEATNSPYLTKMPGLDSTPNSEYQATVTPILFTNQYDLSPELPRQEKSEIIVYRCNGSYDMYLTGPEINIYVHIHLYPGDQIIQTVPPSILMGHKPPEPPVRLPVTPSLIVTQTITATAPSPTVTSQPYPAPDTGTPGN